MPVCVNCAYPAEYVYTTYKTKSNIRLGVCARCDQFLDPLIEHPSLVILLDLILLKPRVYLHLLFNRGSSPSDAEVGAVNLTSAEREQNRRAVLRDDLLKLGMLSVGLETVIKVLPRIVEGGRLALKAQEVVVTLLVVFAQLATQHLVTTLLALLALRIRGWYPSQKAKDKEPRDGRQENFIPSVIPLTLLYTSILPLILQLLLSIWSQPPHPLHSESLPISSSSPFSPVSLLPKSLIALIPAQIRSEASQMGKEASQLWSSTDRVWAGTRLLGGMSSGFGLRVVLPTRPWETTGLVLSGWVAGAVMERALESSWR